MQVVMVSNFLNHHMLPLCLAFYEMPEVDFTFVATTPIEAERVALGYKDMNHAFPFVLCSYESAENEQKARKLCLECDVLYIGMMPASFLKERLRQGKISFRHAERIFKGQSGGWKNAVRALKWSILGPQYGGKSPACHLLCASAFSAKDHSRIGQYEGRAYAWGYFTEFKKYDVEQLLKKKENETPKIVWAGRFLQLKHADAVIITAERLRSAGYTFDVELIGTGPMEQELKDMIREKGLEGCVHMLGAMSPEQVRTHMETANIYLFTSDRGEGWGAVLNEAMNSGCAVVAADQIGAVPYLLKDGENGLVFQSENWDDLYEKVKQLLDNEDFCKRCGHAAYQTMAETWNAEVAAERLLELARCLQEGRDTPFYEGPCSKE